MCEINIRIDFDSLATLLAVEIDNSKGNCALVDLILQTLMAPIILIRIREGLAFFMVHGVNIV